MSEEATTKPGDEKIHQPKHRTEHSTEHSTEPKTEHRGVNVTIFDICSILVSLAGAAYTLLPWGVFQSRLAELDTGLMITAGFILVAAIIAYIGTIAHNKTNGTRNKAIALTARILIWLSILGFIVPIFIRFLTELLNM